MKLSQRHTYLISYWVSGFSAAFAIFHLIESGFVWSGVFLALAVYNYYVGRRSHKNYLGNVLRFDSFADLRAYLDEQELA